MAVLEGTTSCSVIEVPIDELRKVGKLKEPKLRE